MQGLSPTQKRTLTPACPSGLTRLGMYMATGALAVALLGHGLPIPEVLVLLGVVAVLTLALTSPAPAVALTRACAPMARHVLAQAAVIS